jgi:hypothetical protein
MGISGLSPYLSNRTVRKFLKRTGNPLIVDESCKHIVVDAERYSMQIHLCQASKGQWEVHVSDVTNVTDQGQIDQIVLSFLGIF